MPTYAPYDEEDYYTIPNQTFAGDRFAPGSEGAVAFDQPSEQGVRYPIATPQGGTFDFGAVPSNLIRTPEQSAAAYASRDQYNAELARAERNKAEEDAQQDPAAIQQATRMRGLLRYQQLIRDGVPSVQAIREVAPELYFNHPMASVAATKDLITPPRQMSIQPVPGGKVIVNPNGNVHSYIPDPVQKVLPLPKQPEESKVLQRQAAKTADAISSDISKIRSDAKIDPSEKDALIQPLETQLRTARANELFHSTNWKGNFSATGTPPNIIQQANDMVNVVSPDGRVGKIPRSNLEAARKQGYKER